MTEKIEFLLEAIELRLGELVAVFQDINTTISAQKIVQLPKPEKKPVVKKKVSTSDNLVEGREQKGLAQAMEFANLDPSLVDIYLDGSDTIVQAKEYWPKDDGKARWDAFNSFLKALKFVWIKAGEDSHWRKESHEI